MDTVITEEPQQDSEDAEVTASGAEDPDQHTHGMAASVCSVVVAQLCLDPELSWIQAGAYVHVGWGCSHA